MLKTKRRSVFPPSSLLAHAILHAESATPLEAPRDRITGANVETTKNRGYRTTSFGWRFNEIRNTRFLALEPLLKASHFLKSSV